jgi:glucose/arabinose dehydrogenase
MVILTADGSSKSAPLAGLPAVVDAGQGGLLDVALDPDFASDPWVYFSYSEAGSGAAAGTAVARGRLVGNTLQDVAVIFRQLPKEIENRHFGARLAFRGDKTLFVTLGERHLFSPAQDLTGHLGKVVRINRDGSVPSGNPSLGAGAKPEIWSYGHRNPQGAAIHPDTGELWLVEHGPTGGDELNRVLAGNNYGWPLRSYGCIAEDPAAGCPVNGGTHAPSFTEPVSYWAPEAIAPSGLIFYSGDKFPEWRGNAMLGALGGQALWRVALNGNAEAARERLFSSLGERIRCVRQGPDGWLYLLTDSGKLIRIDR